MRKFFLIAICLIIQGCGENPLNDTPSSPDCTLEEDLDLFGEKKEPLENLNHSMLELNLFLDEYILSPASKVYKALTPQFVRTGVDNLTNHIQIPYYMMNDILQWRWDPFIKNFKILIFDTVLGAGTLKLSAKLGHQDHPNDFGITLHRWGAAEGDYLVIPFIGPTNSRDLVGGLFGTMLNPFNIFLSYYKYDKVYYGTIGLDLIHQRHNLGDTLQDMLQDSFDPYGTIKSIIQQKRRSQLKDTS